MGAHGFNWFRAFTGMSGQTGMTGGGMRWYPRNPANNNQYGSQHAEISSTQGLGMYVQSGGSNFMAIKRYGSGPDRQENYARVYTGGLGMKPWSGTQKILRFSSQQQVSQVSAPGTSHGLQKVAFVVTNKTSGHTFEYSLAVMSTSTASNHVSWDVPTSTYYVGGGVQNGVSPTKTHSASGYTATLFSGTGIGTQSGAFPLGTFSFDVSWDNFVSVLRYITYSNNMDGSVNSNVATLFGSNWSSRTNWELRAVRFGQEINNPDYTTYTATIGGRTKELKLDAL
jgi:hypothetical protein